MKVTITPWFALNLSLILSWVSVPHALGQPDRFELVESHEIHPFFNISNFREDQDSPFKTKIVDVVQSRPSSADRVEQFGSNLQLIVRTTTGKRTLTFETLRFRDKSGSVEITGLFTTDELVEIYLVLSARDGNRYLVSNVLELAKSQSPVSARKMTAEETANFDEKLAKFKERKEIEAKIKEEAARVASLPPPEELPTGYTRADINTFLIPGTPVMYGYNNRWLAAEIVLKDGEFIIVCPSGSQSVLRFKDPSWIAVKDEVLAEVLNDTKAYSSRLLLLPRGKLVLRDAVPARGQKITKGTPLHFEGNGFWRIGRFVSEGNDFAWLLEDGSSTGTLVHIDKLAVRLQTLEDAKDPAKKKEWTEKLRTGMAVVKKQQMDVQRRQADFFGSGPTSRRPSSRSSRSSGSSAQSPTEKSVVANSEFRTWRDQSGKFEIRAKLVAKTSTDVTLEKEDKKWITVKIEKLSAADRKFLKD